MAIVAGIDEAGLGPVLGPLVVSSTAFSVPDELVEASLWRTLRGAAGRTPGGRAVAIADSKKLYAGLHGRKGLDHLERGVLAALAAAGVAVTSFAELLAAVCPEASKRACGYPWYAGTEFPLPRSLPAAEVEESARRLSRGLDRTGVVLEEVRVEPVFEEEFNLLIDRFDNKGDLLSEVNGRLLSRLRRRFPGQRLVIHCDRHGGRKRYLGRLQEVFESAWIWVVREDEGISTYHVEEEGRRVELSFTVAGDDRQLPVALASMVSKYVRELFIGLLNRFWAEAVPGLAPSAGYSGDGLRFFREILPEVERRGIPRQLVLRCR